MHPLLPLFQLKHSLLRIAHSALDPFQCGVEADVVLGRCVLERTNESAVAFAKRMVGFGARRIIFTDIARDGMLNGPNVAALQDMLASVPIPVIASGGVGNIDHIRSLAQLGASNLEGVIVGKALYTGAVALPEAIGAA